MDWMSGLMRVMGLWVLDINFSSFMLSVIKVAPQLVLSDHYVRPTLNVLKPLLGSQAFRFNQAGEVGFAVCAPRPMQLIPRVTFCEAL